jgi:hypothetical protein
VTHTALTADEEIRRIRGLTTARKVVGRAFSATDSSIAR